MKDEYKDVCKDVCKVTLRVSPQLAERFHARMKWGQRDRFMRKIMDAVAEAAEEDPSLVPGFLSGAVKIRFVRT